MTRTLVATPDPEPEPRPVYGVFTTSTTTWSTTASSTIQVWPLPANR